MDTASPRRVPFAVLSVVIGLTVVSTASSGGAAFPGANGRLLFITGPETHARLCVVRARGGVPTAVATSRRILWGARWSPRGTKIAYSTRTRYGDGRIIVARPSGASARPVYIGGDVLEFAWSPNGRSIAFIDSWTARGPESAIGIVRTGSRPQQEPRYVAGLSDDLGEYRSADWSPDGRRIAYSFRLVDRFSTDIYTVEVASGRKQQLTADAASDGQPNWSPDGRRIAFASDRDGQDRIYVMAADGSNARRLTQGAPDRDPVWSPDGRSVAFIRVGRSQASIRAISIKTGEERLVARVPKGAYSLDWQPVPPGAAVAPLDPRRCA